MATYYCVCYADDIILLANTPRELETMIADIVAEFREVGLGVRPEKTHWTSTPARELDTITVEGCAIPWQPTLTFVGMVLDLKGSSWAAIRHRMGQGMSAWHRWAPLLTVPWLSAHRKLNLLHSAVGSSVTWGSAIWNTTKAMRSTLDSWFARMTATMLGARRNHEEDIGCWWRRRAATPRR